MTRGIASFLLLLAAFAGTAAPARAQPSETAVKAAFLTKFPAYVDWPSTLHLAPNMPIALCIVGNDPFGRTIDAAARGQEVDHHPLVVKRMPTAAGADGCQVAFVDGDKGHSTAEMLHALQGKPVLTVTDGRAGSDRGIIHFVLDGGRVRFHIDQAAAENCGLSLSARLLAIALSVRTSH
jgi:hypothetical protein